MVRAETDPKIERVQIDGFEFPLGVYPIEGMQPRAGYAVMFEEADGSDAEDGGSGPPPEDAFGFGEDWEAWPDRYVFDAVVPAPRLISLLRSLFQLMPGRIYPILDVMGHDAYREIDPYISYELMGLDRFIDATRRFSPFFFEDGLVGFGAMSDDPFFYVFVDEHKIVTIRVAPELKDKVEKVLAAYDLEPMDNPAGADAAAHEHRTVLATPDDDHDLLGVDEIVERLRDDWRLTLNVDPESNVDDGMQELGLTKWRCLVRTRMSGPDRWRYAEALLEASCLREAEELAFEAVIGTASLAPAKRDFEDELDDAMVVQADRLSPEQWKDALAKAGGSGPDASEAAAQALTGAVEAPRTGADAGPGEAGGGSGQAPGTLPDGVTALRWLD